MMKSTLSFAVFFFYILFGHAQSDLKVLVRELSSGEALESVEITLTNPGIGLELRLRSNSRGEAIFKALPERNDYRLRIAESEKYLGEEIDGIDLLSSDQRSIQIGLINKKKHTLPVAEIRASNTSRINTRNAEVSSQLSRSELSELPVEGRDISRALFRLPTVVQSTGFYPEAPFVSINGANGLYTNYLIDGMDNNEQFLGGMKFPIPVGMVRNITVYSNNYSAEYGLSGNGVINVMSNSGSNEFKGEAFLITRPGPVIDGKSQFAQRDLSGNFVKDGYQRYQGGFGFGGALKKDKSFYYVNAEHTYDLKDNLLNSPALGVNETLRGSNRFNYLSARLDQQWNSRWRSTLRMHLGQRQIERQGGGLDGGVTFPSAGSVQDQNSFIAAWQNSYVKGNFASSSNVQYSRYRWNYARPRNAAAPQTLVLDPSEQTIAILGHPGYSFDSRENTLQFQQKFSFYLDRHTIKVGAEVLSSAHELFGGLNPNGNYLVKLNASQLAALAASGKGASLDVNDIPPDAEVLQYSVELRPSSFGATQNIFSIYFNDEWAVNEKLNLSLGLRWDYDNLSRGAAATGDWNNLAPRLSFNYKLSARTSLRGGYGIFYDKIVYAIYSDALQQNTKSADYKAQLTRLKEDGYLPATADVEAMTYEGNLAASFGSVPYLQGPGAAQLAPLRESIFSNERRILNPYGYDNPYTHQFSLGLQHQVSRHVKFYVDLMHNRGEKLFRLVDVNTPAPWPIDPENVQIRSQTDADAGRRVPVLYDDAGRPFALSGSDTLRGIARNITMTETGGSSRYWAASFNLQKDRGKDNYAYRLIYTLSRLRNNTDDINFKAQDANRFDDEWGPSLNDRTHVINSIFYFWPFDRLHVSLAGLLQSGQPVNRIPDATLYGTTDLNGDGRAFGASYVGNSDRAPGEARNSDRLPWSVVFDAGIQYDLPLAGRKLELRMDVFNIFNAQNLSGYANNATQSNQIQVGPASSGVLVRKNAGPPRQFQFGIRYAF